MNQPDGSAPAAAAAAAAAQAEESNSSGRRSSSSRECLKRSPQSPKAEGSDSVTSQSSPSEEAGMMTEVKVKTEVPDDYIEEVIWQDDTKDSKKNIKDGPGDVPAEICVVIGGVRNQQTLDGKAVERDSSVGYTRNRYSGTWIFDHALRYTSGSYECGICGKKYKYYNCFQTHVRAHRGISVLLQSWESWDNADSGQLRLELREGFFPQRVLALPRLPREWAWPRGCQSSRSLWTALPGMPRLGLLR